MDDVVIEIFVFLSQMVQYPDLHKGLMLKSFFISDNLDRHVLVRHVIQSSDHLSETAFADDF